MGDHALRFLQQSMKHSRIAFGVFDAQSLQPVFANTALKRLVRQLAQPDVASLLRNERALHSALQKCALEGVRASIKSVAGPYRFEFSTVPALPGTAADRPLVQCLVSPELAASPQRGAKPSSKQQAPAPANLSPVEAAPDPDARPATLNGHTSSVTQRALALLNELPLHALLCNATGQVFWSNQAYQLFTAESEHCFHLLSPGWLRKVHPDDQAIVGKTFSSAIHRGKLESFRYRLQDRHGHYQWLLCLGAPLRQRNGQTDAWLVLSVNINRFKVYEELLEDRISHQLAAQGRDRAKLQHAQELAAQAQKMELVSNLAGGVAHDLNNMLFVMGLNADVLGRQIHADSARENLEAIRSSIKKAARLSSQLTSFSGRKPQSLSSIDPKTTIDELSGLLCKAVGAEVDFSVDVAPDVGSILVDKMYFENALINLAINARDAVEGRGQVRLRAFNELREHDGDLHQFVVFEVSDNGAGMSEDIKRKIFEPFFTTKAPGKGTGLGLPMVKLFVDNSGGFTDIRSQSGKGTTVSLYFPLSQITTAEVHATEAPYQLGSELVLVIEDNAEVRETVASTLNMLGYNIVTALNPEHAWKLLQQGLKADLIISDLKMPGQMTILDFLQLLEQAQMDIPLIFATGYTADELVREQRVLNKHTVLFKPFSMQELSHKVRHVLGELSPESEGE